jgi:hypothetical protein
MNFIIVSYDSHLYLIIGEKVNVILLLAIIISLILNE